MRGPSDAPGRPRIAVTLGDPAGIGPEIALKAALSGQVQAMCRTLLVGDPRALESHAAACGYGALPLRTFARPSDVTWEEGAISFLAVDVLPDEPIALGQTRAAYGRAGIEFSRVAIEAALAGCVDAVVVAPQSETAIALAGIPFDGNPSFLARCTGTAVEDVFLMLCFDAYRIVHVTGHLSLRRAIEAVSTERVLKAIAATASALRRLGVERPRIAVSGLNPHAGESGLFGTEEIDIIAPAVHTACERGIAAEGPFGADIMFSKPGFDAFAVMYHDQGHVLAKTLAPNRGAALSIGTPVLLSSVAHGTAFDIAGKNLARPDALIEAIERLSGAAPGVARFSDLQPSERGGVQ